MAAPQTRSFVKVDGSYAWYALTVLVAVFFLNYVDRSIVAILAQDLGKDLAIGNAQLGFLYGTAFVIFFTIFGIPFGRLADSWSRVRLIGFGLAFCSAMTIASAFATSYPLLVLARVGVGIGEAAAAGPAAYSLLADYFSPKRKALAFSIYLSGVYLGSGFSLAIGGWIAGSWNHAFPSGGAPLGLVGWQAVFVAIGIPGLLLALWVLSLREPQRHKTASISATRPNLALSFAREVKTVLPFAGLAVLSRFPGGMRANLVALTFVSCLCAFLISVTNSPAQWIAYGIGLYAVISWAQTLRHVDHPTFTLIFGTPPAVKIVAGFGAVAGINMTMAFWAAPYAIRTFHVDASIVGPAIGIPAAFAAATSIIVGGRLSDAWKQRDVRGRIFTCMLAGLLPLPLIVALFHAKDFTTYSLICPFIYFTCSLWGGSAIAALQDLVLPRMYATAGAVSGAGTALVGVAIGPYSSGKISEISGSLVTGIYSVVFPLALLGFLLLWRASRQIGTMEFSKLHRAQLSGEIHSIE
jgi:MFS family permease